MTRFLVTILAALYLTASTGVTVHMHYCMGSLVGLGLTPQDSDHCSECGMKKGESEHGCCSDEEKQIKIEEDQKRTSAGTWHNALQSVLAVAHFPAAAPHIYQPEAENLTPLRSPPRSWPLPLHIKHCVFRI